MFETQIKPPTYSWNDINTAVGTQIVTIASPNTTGSGASKVTRAILHAIIMNNAGTAWEVDLYDGTTSSAASIGKIRSAAASAVFPYDITLSSGLFIDTVKGTTAGDFTVLYLAE